MPVHDNKRVGLILPQWEGAFGGETARGVDIIRQATLSEDLGLDSVWAVDQFLLDMDEYREATGGESGQDSANAKVGFWECWSIISTLSTATSTIDIGTLVSCTAYRNPALLARMADTVDELSGGRLILGLGAGALQGEFEAFGFDWERRVSRFEEALQIIAPLLKGQCISFEGEFYRVKGVQLLPKGLRPDGPPILIGTLTGGPRMRRLVAQYADHWHCWLAEDSRLAEYVEPYELIVRACERYERDPTSLIKSVALGVCLEGTPPDPGETVLTGSTCEIAAQLKQFFEADVDEVMVKLFPNTPKGLESFARVLAELG